MVDIVKRKAGAMMRMAGRDMDRVGAVAVNDGSADVAAHGGQMPCGSLEELSEQYFFPWAAARAFDWLDRSAGSQEEAVAVEVAGVQAEACCCGHTQKAPEQTDAVARWASRALEFRL